MPLKVQMDLWNELEDVFHFDFWWLRELVNQLGDQLRALGAGMLVKVCGFWFFLLIDCSRHADA